MESRKRNAHCRAGLKLPLRDAAQECLSLVGPTVTPAILLPSSATNAAASGPQGPQRFERERYENVGSCSARCTLAS